MLKFMAGILLGVALFGIVAHVSRGQVANAEMKKKEIMLGDELTMDVSVDPAPNLDGHLYISAGPESGDVQIGMNCNLPKGSAKCSTGQLLSLEATPGKWVIKSIVFQAAAGSTPKNVDKKGDLSFQVIPHGEIVVPEKATISEIK